MSDVEDNEATFDPWLQRVLQRYVHLDHKQKTQTLDSLFRNSDAEQILELNYKIPQLLKRDFITTLPVELCEQILSYVDGHDLLRCCLVNSHWNTLISDYSTLWHAACLKNGAHPEFRKEAVHKESKHYVKMCGRKDRQLSGEKRNTVCNHSHSNQPSSSTHTPCCFYKERFLEVAMFRERLKVVNKSYVTKTLRGHSSRVTCMHQHGRVIATGSDDRSVILWSVDTGERVLTVHCGYCVSCLVFNDSLLITGSFTGMVKSWSLPTSVHHQSYTGDTITIVAVQLAELTVNASHEDLVLALSLYGKVKIWIVDSGVCVFVTDVSAMVNDVIKKSMYIKVMANVSEGVVYSIVLYVENLIVVNRIMYTNCVYSKTVTHVDSQSGKTLQTILTHNDQSADVSHMNRTKNVNSLDNKTSCPSIAVANDCTLEYSITGVPHKECIPIVIGSRFTMFLRLINNCLTVDDSHGKVWSYSFDKLLSGLQLMKRPVYCVGGNHFLHGIHQSHDLFFATSNASDIILWKFAFH